MHYSVTKLFNHDLHFSQSALLSNNSSCNNNSNDSILNSTIYTKML